MISRSKFQKKFLSLLVIFGLLSVTGLILGLTPSPALGSVSTFGSMDINAEPVASYLLEDKVLPNATSLLPVIDSLAPQSCPALWGYDNNLEQTNYCVYYNNPPTPLADATLVEGYVQDYWDRYDIDFGFQGPEFTPPKLEVRITNNTSCNGSAWENYISLYDGCFSAINPEFMQYVTGHELFHRVQFSHDPNWATTWENSGWIYEGTARNMEDVAFANIDTWDNCLGVAFSYCDEVNDYLSSTNANLTSFDMRYESNLFWTFFREQYGTTLTEPQRGVDALVELWNQMATAESVAAVNHALAVLSPGTSFDDAFRQFVVANWTKDLTGLPDDSYNYSDEDQAGNPVPYGPLVPTDGGTIDSDTSASWTGKSVSKYGARYFSAMPDRSDCPVITASFTRTGGSTEFYHVITQNGNTFNTHSQGSGASWGRSYLNNGITKVVAIIGGRSSSATVDIELSCSTPLIDIELPNQLAPAYVGGFATPDNIIVQVSVTDGSLTGPIVSGLANSDFKVEIGGLPALVLGGGFVQDEYFLRVDTPVQAANGPYDLEVFLEEPGTSTVIASDLEPEAVVYDATETDHVIITDVSGSMGQYGKLVAAKDAAKLYIDAANSSEGLGLVSYDQDVVDTLAIEFGTLPHRTEAHTQVNSYIPLGATSIGDGLNEAVTLLGSSPTGNARCQFTLLSDGMQNMPSYWADVEAAVVGTGCPVMSIAFGPDSNELLMQEIADATGGESYYNDVYYISPQSPNQDPDETELDLGDTYMDALCQAQGCERLLSVRGSSSAYGQVFTYTVAVDNSVNQLSAVLDWTPRVEYFTLRLVSPSGVVYADYAFYNQTAGYAGFYVDDPEIGEWKALVRHNYSGLKYYNLMISGKTDLAVDLLPARRAIATGNYYPLYAIWRPGGMVTAWVTSPLRRLTMVQLWDDGQHGDGRMGDGFFAGQYSLVNEAIVVQPVPEAGVLKPPPAADEGAYRVRLVATLDGLQRESQGSFSVPEGDDGDGDGIPDDYIAEHCPGAPNSDADLDQLDCSDEYYTGTDPNNSDTDSGGESDESEAVRHGLDPFNPADDLVEAFDFVHATAQNGSVLLTYDVKSEYASILAYRATHPAGPWALIGTDLPLDGMYTDSGVVNDTTYFYCLQAIDGEDHWSAVVCSEPATPRLDPIPPEAAMLINGGAPSTNSRNVLLTFVPVEESIGGNLNELQDDAFDDITEVQISNDPSMAGAIWQPFQQDIPWQLKVGRGLRTVYVRFMDASGNESIGIETATIQLEILLVFLPSVFNTPVP
jgi:Mg-chelatase subunit ChlD